MFDEKHYVPILKWKRGEQKALELLSNEQKEMLTPLIEIAPIPYDYVNDCPQKTIDKHLENTGEQIEKSWGKERPIFLDLSLVDESEYMEDSRHPLAYILDDARSRNLKVIPVTGSERNNDYQQVVKDSNKKDNLGVCIRIEDDDILILEKNIDNLLNILDIAPSAVDLVIDFKNISPGDEKKTVLSVAGIINNNIPRIIKSIDILEFIITVSLIISPISVASLICSLSAPAARALQ